MCSPQVKERHTCNRSSAGHRGKRTEPAAAQKKEPAAAQKKELAAAQKKELAAAQKKEPAAAQKKEPGAAASCDSAVVRGKGSGWEISARVTSSFTIAIEWSAPRPIMELKIGIGWSVAEENREDVASDKGQKYLIKQKSYATGPKQSGVLEFVDSSTRRFLDSHPIVAAIWDLDFRPAQPLLWSQPFSFEVRHRLLPRVSTAVCG